MISPQNKTLVLKFFDLPLKFKYVCLCFCVCPHPWLGVAPGFLLRLWFISQSLFMNPAAEFKPGFLSSRRTYSGKNAPVAPACSLALGITVLITPFVYTCLRIPAPPANTPPRPACSLSASCIWILNWTVIRLPCSVPGDQLYLQPRPVRLSYNRPPSAVLLRSNRLLHVFYTRCLCLCVCNLWVQKSLNLNTCCLLWFSLRPNHYVRIT